MNAVLDLPTPCLLLDLDVLEQNLAAMQAKADRLGVALRPHAKTPKCLEVARLQGELGARGLTVSTLAEARFFAAGGFDDLTWAFPVQLDRLAEVRELAERVTLRLVVDSEAAVDALDGFAHPFHLLLKVDCGYGRCGVDPASAEGHALARRLADHPRLRFDGLLSHSGDAYAAADRAGAAAVAERERATITAFAERLRGDGVEVETVSVGSTPAMTAVEDLAGVTEARPGNYAFFDGTQAAIGSCTPADCALTLLASVVSCRPGADHAVTDAGALALSKDPGPTHLGERWRWGMGALMPESGAKLLDAHLTALSQEHGKTSRPLPVGSRVRVLPNHSCLAVPNFDAYHLVRGGEVVGRWAIFQGRP